MRFARSIVLTLAILACAFAGAPAGAIEPLPDKLVVLTFDDSARSHYTVVRPLLKQYGFGATFFITEGFDFKTNKELYMTWEEIAELDRDGFEIGNHTADHMSLAEDDPDELEKQLADLPRQLGVINERCREHGIPQPTSFAYPGNGTALEALPILAESGILFARRGGAPEFAYEGGRGVGYEPGLDHPLLVPSAGDARPDWEIEDFIRAVEQAEFGRIAVLQFHGVPDAAHDWVSSPVERFRAYMNYLATHGFRVIAMRDLARFVDPQIAPTSPDEVIDRRVAAIAADKSRDNFRRPNDDAELRRWLENMVWYHRFTVPEIRQAMGLSTAEVAEALEQFDIRAETKPARRADAPLLVLPYPGGRHPRIGFLDGAQRPQRETKLSVFLPWDPQSYVVADVPEAIRRNDEATHGLLYLAHEHVDTMWTKRGETLEPLEWHETTEGAFEIERTLPSGVRMGTRAIPGEREVRMEMWLVNGSNETLSELRVQNCVMLKGAPEFAHDGEGQTVHAAPFLARKSNEGDRWLIMAWEPCQRTWANPPCPCLHSDPQFADCAPGETQHLRGWLSFYEGKDMDGELQRIRETGWLTAP